MLKKVVVPGLIFVLVVSVSFAQETGGIIGNRGNQLAGLRLGVYHFATSDGSVFSEHLRLKSSTSNGFAAELFFNYFILDQLALEVSLGSVSRGDIVFESDTLGTLTRSGGVYQIGLGIKITPLSGFVSDHYQPYFHGGGSFVSTTESRHSGRGYDPYYSYDFDATSRTNFGWWVGGGFESYVSSVICVTSNIKYHSIHYSEYIAGYKDHSGYQISFGAAYILRKK